MFLCRIEDAFKVDRLINQSNYFGSGLNPNSKSSGFDVDANLEKLEAALTEAENILNLALSEEMKVMEISL